MSTATCPWPPARHTQGAYSPAPNAGHASSTDDDRKLNSPTDETTGGLVSHLLSRVIACSVDVFREAVDLFADGFDSTPDERYGTDSVASSPSAVTLLCCISSCGCMLDNSFNLTNDCTDRIRCRLDSIYYWFNYAASGFANNVPNA
jgi:hypothetical protein